MVKESVSIGKQYGELTPFMRLESGQYMCECVCGKRVVVVASTVLAPSYCTHVGGLDYAGENERVSLTKKAITRANKVREKKPRVGPPRARDMGEDIFNKGGLYFIIYVLRACYMTNTSVKEMCKRCGISERRFSEYKQNPLKRLSWNFVYKFISLSGYPFRYEEVEWFYSIMMEGGHDLKITPQWGKGVRQIMMKSQPWLCQEF